MSKYIKELKSLAGYTGFKPEITSMLNSVVKELEDDQSTCKWYVKVNSAEDDCYSVVELNDRDVDAINRFLNAEYISGGGYSGMCHLVNRGFESREDAINAILNNEV